MKYAIEGYIEPQSFYPYPGAEFIDHDKGREFDAMCVRFESDNEDHVRAALAMPHTTACNIEVGDEYAYFATTRKQGSETEYEWTCQDHSVDIDPKVGVSVGLPEIEMDPTPYCGHCGAMQKANCKCPPDAID